MVLVKQTHRMEDVVEAAAGGEAVVGVNPLQASDGQEHSNRRAEGKEGPGVEAELWVINRYLQERGKKTGSFITQRAWDWVWYLVSYQSIIHLARYVNPLCESVYLNIKQMNQTRIMCRFHSFL